VVCYKKKNKCFFDSFYFYGSILPGPRLSYRTVALGAQCLPRRFWSLVVMSGHLGASAYFSSFLRSCRKLESSVSPEALVLSPALSIVVVRVFLYTSEFLNKRHYAL